MGYDYAFVGRGGPDVVYFGFADVYSIGRAITICVTRMGRCVNYGCFTTIVFGGSNDSNDRVALVINGCFGEAYFYNGVVLGIFTVGNVCARCATNVITQIDTGIFSSGHAITFFNGSGFQVDYDDDLRCQRDGFLAYNVGH